MAQWEQFRQSATLLEDHLHDLPIAVMVRFDSYTPDPCFMMAQSLSHLSAIAGLHLESSAHALKLAWAVTIHRPQSLTLNKVVIHIANKEFSAGLTFVACSRVRQLEDLIFHRPLPYQRLQTLGILRTDKVKTRDFFHSSRFQHSTTHRNTQ